MRSNFGDRLPSLARRAFMRMVGISMLAPVAGCGNERIIKNGTYLNVVVHSYIDRPILDILFNGNDLGVAGAYGGTGTITGVHVPLGIQKLTWRLDGSKGMKRLGETVTARNQLRVRKEHLTADTQYIGLHLYQDETVDVTFSTYIPELSARGEEIMRTKQRRSTGRSGNGTS